MEQCLESTIVFTNIPVAMIQNVVLSSTRGPGIVIAGGSSL